MALLRQGMVKSVAERGPRFTGQTKPGEPRFFFSDICMSQDQEEYRELVMNGPAPAIAAALMRTPRVNFFVDTLWVKESGTLKRSRWHQD